MDLLLIFEENKSHYVYIKDFNRLMFNKTKNKIKNTFVDIVYSVLVLKKFWQNIKKLLSNKWQTKCIIRKRFY